MLTYVLGIIGWLAVVVTVAYCASAGFRNGDRPDDALVHAALRGSGQPDEERPVAVVTVRNRGGSAVLAAVGTRRALLPGWLTGPVSVVVPRRTARRAFRPGGYPAVGVVEGGATAELTGPVPAGGRRYLVTVLVGQPERRLRVHRLRLAAAPARGRRDSRPRYRLLT